MEKSNLNNEQETYLAQWMEGDLSDAELAKYVLEEDITFYKKLRLGTEVLRPLEDITFTSIQNKIAANKKTKSSRKRNLQWGIAVAASLVLFVTSYFFLQDHMVTIDTSFSEQKTIQLVDGSEVMLNAKTQMSYNEKEWIENRELQLDGEAYFKVQKGNTFTVVTSNGTVEVLGTEFNVKTTLDYFEVTCYEGKVEVSNDDSSQILLPGMTLRRINGDPVEEGTSLQKQPSWIYGESTFKSVPLKYVIAELENQYSLTFNTTAIDDNLSFTGSFGHDNRNVALSTVFNAMRMEYSYNDQKVIVLRPYE